MSRFTPQDLAIRPLEHDADYRACVHLQELTWGAGFGEAVPPTILRLAQSLGGIATGAFAPDGRLLGFVFGLTGWVDGSPLHWSDMLAVHPDARDAGLGQALKRYQRLALLDRGVSLARWSFEPLEARNARLNLSILAATAATYVRDFYGDSPSSLHTGIGTDRLIADWHLDSDRVARRLDGSDPPPAAPPRSLPQVVPFHIRSGMARPDEPRIDLDHHAIGIAVPADIQALKRADPGLASAWRAVTRSAFEACLARGFRAVELVRDGPVGVYVLVDD